MSARKPELFFFVFGVPPSLAATSAPPRAIGAGYPLGLPPALLPVRPRGRGTGGSGRDPDRVVSERHPANGAVTQQFDQLFLGLEPVRLLKVGAHNGRDLLGGQAGRVGV